MKQFLGLLCMLTVWSVLSACTAEPTRTALTATPLSSSAALVKTIGTETATTNAPTLGPTPVLGRNAEQDLATLRAAARDAQGGFLFYLDAPVQTNNPQVLTIPNNEPFEAVIVAGNYGIKDHDFAMLCIVDYIQRPCNADVNEMKYQFHLASSAETRLKVNLPLDPGTHDLLFLTFYDPTNHSSDHVFRQESRFLFSFYRARIIAGGVETRPELNLAGRFSVASKLEPGSGFFTIRRDAFTGPSQAPWHSHSSAKGEPVDFVVSYSNPEQVKRTVALMAFVDFDQVPWDLTHSSYFGELDAGARADVHARPCAPQLEGEHELIVVSVDNPFLDLEAEVGADEPRSFFVESSDRVLLTVRQ